MIFHNFVLDTGSQYFDTYYICNIFEKIKKKCSPVNAQNKVRMKGENCFPLTLKISSN